MTDLQTKLRMQLAAISVPQLKKLKKGDEIMVANKDNGGKPEPATFVKYVETKTAANNVKVFYIRKKTGEKGMSYSQAVSLVESTSSLLTEVQSKKVWKDFTTITTNRPSKSDIKTLKYKEYKKFVLIDWGSYKHLGGCRFPDAYFEDMGTDRAGFIAWLESQGVTKQIGKS